MEAVVQSLRPCETCGQMESTDGTRASCVRCLRAALREAVTVLDEIGDTSRYDDSGPWSFCEAIHRVQWLARRLRATGAP